jgi:hypothetical protein
MRRALTSVLVVLGTLAALVVGASPASAATTVTLVGVQANGQVGVPQYLTATVAIDGSPCGSVLTPAVNIIGTVSAPGQVLGQATFSTCVGAVFQYTFQWLPATAGPIWLNADVNGIASSASRSNIAAVPTTTRVQSPSVAQIGVPVTLTASVTANNGSQASPQGSIQFGILGGGNIGAPVALNNAVPSTVQIQWTPAAVGLQNIIATYIPGPNSASFTCQGSCTSAVDPVQVTTTGVKMFLANPPQFSAGVPGTVTAVVSVVPPSGSVTFTVNGSVIAANVPVQSGGLAQAQWTPPAPGQFTLAAAWRGGGGQSASAQDVVSVGTAPATPDVITLGPAGQPAWSPLGVYTLANGTSITLVTRTASGAPVTLTDAGPCGLQGTQFTVTSGTGQCRVIANSPGGNGYGAAQAIYTVNLTPGTQTSVAPIRASGRVNRNITIVLARPGQNVTNAGQEMEWRVTDGRNRCQLRFPANGAVQLRTVRQGSCTVRATAPAIGGQWNRMVINRTYRVR